MCRTPSRSKGHAIHAMQTIFNDETTDAILLIDASNEFDCMNCSVAYTESMYMPSIATYVSNTCQHPSRLFVAGAEIKSQEGTTQRDPLAMPWFLLNTVPVIQSLRNRVPSVK